MMKRSSIIAAIFNVILNSLLITKRIYNFIMRTLMANLYFNVL